MYGNVGNFCSVGIRLANQSSFAFRCTKPFILGAALPLLEAAKYTQVPQTIVLLMGALAACRSASDAVLSLVLVDATISRL